MKAFGSGRWFVTEGEEDAFVLDAAPSLSDEFSASDDELATEVK